MFIFGRAANVLKVYCERYRNKWEIFIENYWGDVTRCDLDGPSMRRQSKLFSLEKKSTNVYPSKSNRILLLLYCNIERPDNVIENKIFKYLVMKIYGIRTII